LEKRKFPLLRSISEMNPTAEMKIREEVYSSRLIPQKHPVTHTPAMGTGIGKED